MFQTESGGCAAIAIHLADSVAATLSAFGSYYPVAGALGSLALIGVWDHPLRHWFNLSFWQEKSDISQ
jgi:hypothetical protein